MLVLIGATEDGTKELLTVADGQLGRGKKPQAFELAQKFTPGLGAFAAARLSFGKKE